MPSQPGLLAKQRWEGKVAASSDSSRLCKAPRLQGIYPRTPPVRKAGTLIPSTKGSLLDVPHRLVGEPVFGAFTR